MTFEPPHGEPQGRGTPGSPSVRLAVTILVVIALVVAAALWGPWGADGGTSPRGGLGVESDEEGLPPPREPDSHRAPGSVRGYYLI